MPNLPAQPVGPNDLLDVSVYDAPEFSHTVRIGSDGIIHLPMLKQPIKAQGLMPAELETVIAHELVSEQLLVDPVVTVTIAEYQSHPITVTGSVKTPGTFQASTPMTLLEVLARAGGVEPEAGLDVLVTRTMAGPDGKPFAYTRRIPLQALRNSSDPSLNIVLHGGEEVQVPEAGKVFVVGMVKNPGAYSVRDGGQLTIMQIIALAQGLEGVREKNAYIYRKESAGSKSEIPVDLNKIMKRQAPDVVLVANDLLYIPENTGRKNTMAALTKVLEFSTQAGLVALTWGVIHP